jgi:hypothetical protein
MLQTHGAAAEKAAKLGLELSNTLSIVDHVERPLGCCPTDPSANGRTDGMRSSSDAAAKASRAKSPSRLKPAPAKRKYMSRLNSSPQGHRSSERDADPVDPVADANQFIEPLPVAGAPLLGRESRAPREQRPTRPTYRCPARGGRAREPMKLKRALLWVWLALSVLWVGCILGISGQCIYGPWISWQPPRCDAPLINPVETYIADIATALGPPAAVLLLHRLVMWWSRRYRRSR